VGLVVVKLMLEAVVEARGSDIVVERGLDAITDGSA
jgi:hypothetical protein